MATTVTQPTQPEIDQATGKFVHLYQPRDAEGQFIGKPYRFLYTDHMDLVRQIEEAKENADRYIHEVKTGKRQVNGEAALARPEFKPAPESAEEADKKRREEFRKTAEEEFGAPLDEVRGRLKLAGELDEYMIANTWALQNEANGYYICPQNARDMMKFINGENPEKKKLRLSAANLDLAFDALKDKLVQQPQEQVPADSTQHTPPTRTEARPQSTGIIPGQFAGTRSPNRTEKQPLTADRFREIAKMSYPQFTRLKRDNPTDYWNFVKMKEAKAQPQQ
jgi:hypothetical protein